MKTIIEDRLFCSNSDEEHYDKECLKLFLNIKK